jgi:DNA-binding response OmpR family regulator
MTATAGSPQKILVIDDDTLVRRMLGSALKKKGYVVLEAVTGETGLMAFKKSAPDIVITDLLMPDKNGLETIVAIRAINSNVKIIAMSGGGASGDGDFLELASQIGAAATICKPFTVEEIEAVLESLTD